jgi:hypothetical protein
MADPVCPRLSGLVADAAEAAGAEVARGGTYLAMEGPQFSTRAESRSTASWGCDVIGMTAMPEAKLAREAELPYASSAWSPITIAGGGRGRGRGVGDHRPAPRQCRHRAAHGRRTGQGAAEGAGALADRHQSRQRHHHRPDARDPAMLARLDAICRLGAGHPLRLERTAWPESSGWRSAFSPTNHRKTGMAESGSRVPSGRVLRNSRASPIRPFSFSAGLHEHRSRRPHNPR